MAASKASKSRAVNLYFSIVENEAAWSNALMRDGGGGREVSPVGVVTLGASSNAKASAVVLIIC